MKLKWITGTFMALFSVFVLIAVVGGMWLDKSKPTNTAASSTPKPKAGATTSVSAQTKTVAQKPSYKNGVFTGRMANNIYGPVQVQVIIAEGKIIEVAFLQMPTNSSVSQNIATHAEPVLRQETLRAQSAQVAVASRATYDSKSYIQSLQSALSQAKTS